MAKWIKGQSGNPGGRPAGHGEIREIARKHTSAAVNTLVKVMADENAPPSARVGAATALLDRGWGRPAQSIRADIGKQFDDSAVLDPIADKLLAKLASERRRKEIDAVLEADAGNA